MQQARVSTAHKIAWFLEKTGADTTWWNKVLEGTQDPFEKMVWGEGVKGAGQLVAINGEQPELPDDHVLEL
jgi:hypothetical protein